MRSIRPRSIWLIAKGVLLEAVRRREIYTIVLIGVLLIGAVMTVDFFAVSGLVKFYREMALNIMGMATAVAVIVLAARQLPREFENRTIYPLLARPISRTSFMFGKLIGVMLAGIFCYSIFMLIFIIGSIHLGGSIPIVLFSQHIFLQMLMLLVLATLSFWLSMMLNMDAAITVAAILYFTASITTRSISFIYDFVGEIGKIVLLTFNFVIPQLTLFSMSEKAVHDDFWEPIPAKVILTLVVYALIFASIYFGLALLAFRRKPL